MRSVLFCLLMAVSTPLGAQSVPDLIARADSLHDALKPMDALAACKDALAVAPGEYQVLWRAAQSQIDIAKQIRGEHEYTVGVRDSVYDVAIDFAHQAIAADSNGAEGWTMLAIAMGQRARTKGGRDRVRDGKAIYDAAARALELDSTQDGAHHVLGAWNAEVLRLSGVTRFFAKTFMGGGYMDRANWDSAAAEMQQAIRYRPNYIFHHLELARIYQDMHRPADAIAQLEMIPSLPTTDVLDAQYREEAAALLEELRST